MKGFVRKLIGYEKQPELRTLKIILKSISKNSYLELEKIFSSMEGITCPGLDVPTKKFETVYDPSVISKEKILQIVKKLGYCIEKVFDS
ncbi:hypothetical protein HYV89_04665 [Candidatus Woesearchaeota archaeon]|nr:hypothetical protein [Candidatus Woesearchaeota archaeon]